jgi:hypothetical protein
MATVTSKDISLFANCHYCYEVTGIVDGSQTITTPTPPAAGSFPVAADWTPTRILFFPDMTGAVGARVTPDLSTIANSAGVITFTAWSTGTGNALMVMF